MKLVKKMFFTVVIILAAYLSIGYLCHLVIFPEKRPEVRGYFKPGDSFYSKAEGFHQLVVRQENGLVFCTLEIDPFADGPPAHIHTGFDEYLEITEGEITVWLNGETKTIQSGEKLKVSKGTPHKFYNTSGSKAYMKKEYGFPEDFAFYLSQVYGYMDQDKDFGKMPGTLFQMCMFQAEGFDSYMVDGPPVFIQKTMTFLVIPWARLAGYKSYNEKYVSHLGKN